MSFIIGSVTLPAPVDFTREIIEVQRVNLLLNATTTRNFITRKERFVLQFQHLTPAEVSSILSEYELYTTRNFSVSETNLTISATQVLIDVTNREYATKGTEFRENLTLILTEVT